MKILLTDYNTQWPATHHIHMVQVKSEFWNRHLLFRDFLRLHPDISDEYGQLKQKLALHDWAHSNDYADAKTEFIRMTEKKVDFFFNKGVT